MAKPQPLPQFTFSASVTRLLRPIAKGMKRMGLLKVAPRVQGKIVQNEAGVNILIVEQKGQDIWRGRHKSIASALEADEAHIGLDRILAQRAEAQGVRIVLVLVEEQRKVYVTPLAAFFDDMLYRTRANYQGRATRLVPMKHFRQQYLGPVLHTKPKRARQTA